MLHFSLCPNRTNTQVSEKQMDDQTQRGIMTLAEGENKDPNSDLPYFILPFILSLLRLKDAVETSMVSRQWRHLWRHLVLKSPNLVFDIPNIFGSKYDELFDENGNLIDVFRMKSGRECFVRRVNKFLELYSGTKVESLKVEFYLDGECTEDLDRWVRFAITKGVEALNLHLFRGIRASNDDLYVFPHWILSELRASTLKHLELHRCVLKPPPDFDLFSNLTNLCLGNVVVDPDYLEQLISSCLLLESFTLKNCTVGSNLIIGPSPRLHDLKVLTCYRFGKIKIDAVNLSSLEFDGYNTDISFMRTPQLVDFFYKVCSKSLLPYGLTQLTLCPGLESLHLHIGRFSNQESIPQTVPIFRNLKKIKLDLLKPAKFDLRSVVNILKAAPLLEELITTTRAAYCEGEMRDLDGFQHDHLKKVKMQGFRAMWYEIELAICILEIATKLEVMVIDPCGKYYDGDGKWIKMVCLFVDGNERGMPDAEERLKAVKTDAQVIIL